MKAAKDTRTSSQSPRSTSKKNHMEEATRSHLFQSKRSLLRKQPEPKWHATMAYSTPAWSTATLRCALERG